MGLPCENALRTPLPSQLINRMKVTLSDLYAGNAGFATALPQVSG